jgi:hypothetical protein
MTERRERLQRSELKKALAPRASPSLGFSPLVTAGGSSSPSLPYMSSSPSIHSWSSSPSTSSYFQDDNGMTPRTRFSPNYTPPPPDFGNCGFNPKGGRSRSVLPTSQAPATCSRERWPVDLTLKQSYVVVDNVLLHMA